MLVASATKKFSEEAEPLVSSTGEAVLGTSLPHNNLKNPPVILKFIGVGVIAVLIIAILVIAKKGEEEFLKVNGYELKPKALLEYAKLSGQNLSNANLSGSNLRGAHLDYSDLSGADLSYADLSAADLTGANLQNANLYCADLHLADLHAANFTSANLASTNLNRANLMWANLTSANFRYADLFEVKISYANQARVIWDGARLPDGLYRGDLAEAGLVLFGFTSCND